jgi:hypothetical protein
LKSISKFFKPLHCRSISTKWEDEFCYEAEGFDELASELFPFFFYDYDD